MNKDNCYKNLLEAIIEGENENKKLKEYIKQILPEKSNDKEYIDKIMTKVCDMYDRIDLDVDIYWIAENYIDMLREVKAF